MNCHSSLWRANSLPIPIANKNCESLNSRFWIVGRSNYRAICGTESQDTGHWLEKLLVIGSNLGTEVGSRLLRLLLLPSSHFIGTFWLQFVARSEWKSFFIKHLHSFPGSGSRQQDNKCHEAAETKERTDKEGQDQGWFAFLKVT